jgi:two-component system NtrC family sensor kinase
VNDAICQLSGVRREELLGRSPFQMIVDDEVPHAKEHFKSALAGSARRFECHVVRADGAVRLLSVTNTPIRHGPRVIGVLGVARDVTDERERALALERSETRYSRLVEAASDAIFTVDARGALTSINRSLERSSGRDRAELLGTPFAALIDERDRVMVDQVLRDSFDGQRTRAELRYPSVTGDIRICSLTLTPLREGDGQAGALGIVRDVTDERRLTEQLIQQEKLAAVGQLVSGVAHELNNPLASVMAFAQLLLASPRMHQAEDRSSAEAINQEARRATKIVSNLLTFARQHQPQRTITDLNRVVEDTIELRRYAMRVAQVDLELRLDPHLPLTWADPFQLQQVVLNLITNAEQALASWDEARHIVVSTEMAGEHLVLRVSDTGPGITAENIQRVFNPFFTTKPVGEGTGLGLSISDGIVREHGGRIRAETNAQGGATFVVELPHVEPSGVAPAVESTKTATSGPSRRILVVDDEPAIRTAIGTYFRSLGHFVQAVATGREALTLAALNMYDAVLLDLRLPDISGDQVFAELRRVSRLGDRIIFMTGDTQSESARKTLAATGRPTVSKPFLLDDLAAVVLAQPSG